MSIRTPQQIQETLVTPILGVVSIVFTALVTTRTLAPSENVVHITTSAATATLTLPDIRQAAGQTYTIILRTKGNGVLTIATTGCVPIIDAAGAITGGYVNNAATLPKTLTDEFDKYVLYSDGVYWHILTAVTDA